MEKNIKHNIDTEEENLKTSMNAEETKENVEDGVNIEEEKKSTKYLERTLLVSLIIFVLYLLISIIRAGVWNLIIQILATLVFVGWFFSTENVFAKIFCGLCIGLSILKIMLTILGKYGFFIVVGYVILTIIAAVIASKIDEKENNK